MLPTWNPDFNLEHNDYPHTPEKCKYDLVCAPEDEHDSDDDINAIDCTMPELGGAEPFPEGANIEGLVVERKTGWNNTLCVTAQPLHCTPFLYQGRLSVGFEVMVLEVEKNWAGTVEVGFTCFAEGDLNSTKKNDMRARFRKGTFTCTQDAVTIHDGTVPEAIKSMYPKTRGEDVYPKTRGEDAPPRKSGRPTAVGKGTRIGMMIHIDCSAPEVVVYHDHEPYSKPIPLADLLDIMELPENSSSVHLNGFEVGAPLYGCIELYGQCAAVRMMHDQLRPFVPEFTPEVYRSLPRPVQSSIVCLFTLQQTESIISLLPSEVVFIVCAFLMPTPGQPL
eukprot:TRINITY_DN1127_c0_g1_i3.p1 TRINITY_DN1127_c0_g1~~TRINITY_DN1127_c0_g1_i3.p1  ORF type:complete len:393 (-),score=77.97 TRINITY_DN1127_c0_g1_i3:154-1158(-)